MGTGQLEWMESVGLVGGQSNCNEGIRMWTGQLEWKESVGLVGGRSNRNEAKASISR